MNLIQDQHVRVVHHATPACSRLVVEHLANPKYSLPLSHTNILRKHFAWLDDYPGLQSEFDFYKSNAIILIQPQHHHCKVYCHHLGIKGNIHNSFIGVWLKKNLPRNSDRIHRTVVCKSKCLSGTMKSHMLPFAFTTHLFTISSILNYRSFFLFAIYLSVKTTTTFSK